ncbi:MAG TPA: methylated-DNA--[protein]-cysteine S-methyltransferase [bacterium]|nr:methylated-DNA--[protein]-cysteine S-methyltransferase [bacterium]
MERVHALRQGAEYFVYRTLGGVVTAAGWERRRPAAAVPGPWDEAVLAYLTGGGDALLRQVPVDLTTLSPFAQEILIHTRRLRFGQTATYQELAAAAGKPGGARAAGQALGCNPVPLFIPCHRVLAAGGWGGFSAGLARKRRLLALEGAVRPAVRRPRSRR